MSIFKKLFGVVSPRAVLVIILCIVAVAFPPKTYWTMFYDFQTESFLCNEGLMADGVHEVAEVEGGNPANRAFLYWCFASLWFQASKVQRRE